VASPSLQTIPAQNLKSSPVMETPVPVANKTVVETLASKTSGSATLVPIPTLATGAVQEATSIQANKMPEQVLGQPKATEALVTPPSVINAVKAPAKQN